VEDLLAERGIIVSCKAIRRWCWKLGPEYARRLKKKQGRLGDTWHLDELFIRINGQQQYLWRAVDQDGDVIDILLQSRRDQRAAERFLRRLLRGQGKQPFRIITDKLKSYSAASRTTLPGVTHDTQQYANNRAENFASAYSDERTTNAPIQIAAASSALSVAPRCRPESILRCTTFAEIDSSPSLEISVLRGLAKGNGGLTIPNSPLQSAQTRSDQLKLTTPAAPLTVAFVKPGRGALLESVQELVRGENIQPKQGPKADMHPIRSAALADTESRGIHQKNKHIGRSKGLTGGIGRSPVRIST
jgi:transposase-like protein